MPSYAPFMGETARALLGEPTDRRGTEWRYGTHGSLAIDTDEGTWYDHEHEEGGGTLDLIQRETGAATVKAAIRWLETQGIKPEEKSEPTPKRKPKPRIVETYDYVDAHGELLFQVCRMQPKTFRQRRPDGNGWSWSVKGVQQVPYRLPDLLDKPKATVLIVEGEKDVDRLHAHGLTATCNAGGAGKWPDALNQHLQGRRVVLVPDNDDAGRKHAETVAGKLHGIAASVRVLHLPGLPDKGDVSDWLDSGGTREQLIEACKRCAEWEPPVPDEPADDDTPDAPDAPFRALGFDEGNYYYLPASTQQVTAISAGSHTNKSHLLSISPLEWWESRYGDKNGPDWTAAANDCMRLCERAGSFDQGVIRGRGAWYDDGRSVLHLGDRLQVDGQPTEITRHATRYVYERKPPMESLRASDPLDADESCALLTISQSLSWQEPVNATLLCGWLALAPICGALKWRPHVWITGQRGSGKSWIVDNIIAPTLGASAVTVQSNSTEAGIRQKLRQDARPVVFDEAEGESHHGRNRMQSVLELARQASSEGVAEIAKGTAGGKALTFRVRSMFLMGSINVGLAQASDKSRFTVLSLSRPAGGAEGSAHFAALEKLVGNTLTPDWCARLRSRTYSLIPQIRSNAETLARIAGEVIGNRRAGDQIGTLLAGAYALRSDEVITEAEARAWVESHTWDGGDDEIESDEMQCVSEIMHAQVTVEADRARHVRSVAQLVQLLTGQHTDADVGDTEAEEVLSRHGVRVTGSAGAYSVLISESHPEIKRMLRETPWGGGWGRVLSRLPGGQRKATVRFSGLCHRAVSIPVATIMPSEPAPQPVETYAKTDEYF